MQQISIDNEQAESFENNGFVVVGRLAQENELSQMLSTCRRLLDEQAGRENGAQFDLAGPGDDMKKAALPQIMWPSKYAPELAELDYRQRAKAVAEQFLGGEVQLTNEHMIFKPPFHGSETPWHQDQAYHDPNLIHRNVNIWLALEDATIENGCMQYVPGSHKLDVLPHHSIGHDPRAAGLEVDDPKQYVDQAETCPLAAGEAVVHRSYVLHYAGPNHTDKSRAAYILVFSREPLKRDEPREFPWLTERHDGRKAAKV